MGTTSAEALRRLREAGGDGRLEAIVHTRELTLVTVFGSVVDDPASARDIDIAVTPGRGTALDILGVINDLLSLTGSDDVDLLDLGEVASAVPLALAGYRRYVAVVAGFVSRG